MQFLVVFAVLSCLGMATAAPSEMLVRALLKRLTADVAAEEGAVTDAKDRFVMPTEQELVALEMLGGAIRFMAGLAAKDPKELVDFVLAVQAEIKKEVIKQEAKSQKSQKPAKVSKGIKRLHRSKRDTSSEGIDQLADLKAEMAEHGVYNVIVSHIGVTGLMLEHARVILSHMIKGPDCTDCPALPKEIENILMGNEQDEDKDNSWETEMTEWDNEKEKVEDATDDELNNVEMPEDQEDFLRRLLEQVAKTK